VTGFGSIFVNGIEFDTAGATITLNGQSGAAADLRLGQVVTVRGTFDPSGTFGTAETVVFESNVQGPIDSIDPVTNSLIVLGQIVHVDATTQFGDTPFSALVAGNIVAVSGFADAEGELRATRVDKTQDAFTPGTELEVEGTVSKLDETQQTFMLNTLQVDFSTAQLINLPEDQPRNGQVVVVKSAQDVVDGVLFADSVEAKVIGIQGTPGEAVELQGLVTRVISADTFEVNGQPVRLTPATLFDKGTAADIAVNVRLEVEGVFDAQGIIVAEDVEFGASVDIEGFITQVISADTFEVEGRPVRFTPDTVFGHGTAADIMVGVHVEVEGDFDTQGVLVATEIDFLVDLEGVITRVISADTFEVEGRPVRFTPDTVFSRGTAADIVANARVDIEGFVAADGVLVATEIEFLQ
jgi:hypothetical protein